MAVETAPECANLKALRLHGRKNNQLDDVAPQKCGHDEVRLQIAFCGICGTDIHEYLGGPIFAPQPGMKNKVTGIELPVTLGHEFSGTVIELGQSVKSLKYGQRVIVNPALDERHLGMKPCSPCKTGCYNICKRSVTYGLSAEGGGFCEQSVVKATSCIPLPDSVSLKVGALSEPLAVAWHCIRVSGFKQGQTALILGAGPIGLAILCLLKVWGVAKTIISEVTEARIDQAKKFGADAVVNPLEPLTGDREDEVTDPVVAACRDLTGGDGVDVSFDATGMQSTLDAAIAAAKPRGIIFNVAIHERPLLLNLNLLAQQEKSIKAGISYTNEDFHAVLKVLAEGKIPAEQLITSVVPLSDVLQGGFMELINNKAQHVKILIQPDPDV
ncbi:GroES-like protein [Hyaloscypha bicolor E]|uniref:GroES-like protein n=1 Tax=Hyaloscypha bicolor E TaxID=1095630 RepID=A0A2J6SPW0_9HELO|nr:GroES-like protein [Hyaloscypha bicolor E]PMD52828.1 GroES-like protein [Hyaloscypha bicolor E]